MNIYIAPFSQLLIFYVYSYLREDGTPYYIGKGIRDRAFNPRHRLKPKDHTRIQIISENMNEADAFQLEMLLIYFYGRSDLNNGILHNLTNGGDGLFGHVQTDETKKKRLPSLIGNKRALGNHHSEETKRKQRVSKIGVKNPFFNKTHTKEVIKKISLANKGKIVSKETRLRMSEAQKKVPRKGTVSPNKGKTMTSAQKLKISLAKKGTIPWNKARR